MPRALLRCQGAELPAEHSAGTRPLPVHKGRRGGGEGSPGRLGGAGAWTQGVRFLGTHPA